MKKDTAAVLGALLWIGLPGAASSQEMTIEVAPDRLLAADEGAELVEPHLSVSPADPSHLLAAAMIVRTPDLSILDCTVLATFDGGGTWVRHDFGLSQCGDPWTLITPAGTALVSVLGEAGILVFRSPDGGRTWPTEPVIVAGAHDHEMMVLDPSDGSVLLVSALSQRSATGSPASAVFVGRSSDDGRSFEEIGRPVANNLSYEAITPVVTPDGDLLVPIQDHHTWGGRRLLTRRSWLLASSDSGRSFAPPRLIFEGCNRTGPAGWPSVALSSAGSGGARLLWVCEGEGHEGVWLTVSDDLGENWSEPKRVDEGGGEREAAWTKIPTLAAGPGREVALTWFDRGEGIDGCHHLRVALSVDAGDTFTPPARVSSEPSCEVDADVGGRFVAGGDYSGLASVGPGTFMAVWSDARSGAFALYQTTVLAR